jgi:nucleotide-binding universal stress UspA family protein
MAFQRIFVALAHSHLTSEVFEQALAIAKSSNVDPENPVCMMLFHCIPVENQLLTPYPSVYGEEMISFAQVMRQQMETQSQQTIEWLTSYEKTATEAGLMVEWDWKMGDPGSHIRELSRHWQADLIVLGRRGLKGVAEIFLGSVSNYIIHHAHCSVLIVQHPNQPAAS